MSRLSPEFIEAAEKAILSDMLVPEGSIVVPSISCQYYNYAIEMWNDITKEEMPLNTYFQFASNAMGMQSYGYYKANNGRIYIIEAFINEIRKVYIPSNSIECLTDLLNNKNNINYEQP